MLQPPPPKTVEHRRVIKKAQNSKVIILKRVCLKIGRKGDKMTRKNKKAKPAKSSGS
jgi:hypothetical protein